MGIGSERVLRSLSARSGDKAFAHAPRIHVFVFRISASAAAPSTAVTGLHRHVQTRSSNEVPDFGGACKYSAVEELWFGSEKYAEQFCATRCSSAGSDDDLVLLTRSHVVFNPEAAE
jgi:hypothetical protein